jgi:hypothetical protein
VLENERAKKMIQHKCEIDDTLWFGKRDIKTTPSYPQTFCGGILSYIDSGNATSIGGALSRLAARGYRGGRVPVQHHRRGVRVRRHQGVPRLRQRQR